MFCKKAAPPPTRDAGEQQIDDLEALIVRAHDEKVLFGVSAEEVAHERPVVVAQAKAVCDQLRTEHRARQAQSR